MTWLVLLVAFIAVLALAIEQLVVPRLLRASKQRRRAHGSSAPQDGVSERQSSFMACVEGMNLQFARCEQRL
jgi:hypothetical protein